jgi:hypothetical protein
MGISNSAGDVKKYRHLVIAAGHQIRAVLGPYGASGVR